VDLRADSIDETTLADLARVEEIARNIISVVSGEARRGYPRREYRMSNQFDPASPPILTLYDDVTRTSSIVHESPGAFYVSPNGLVVFTSM
jgi:hypothetical protein